MDSSDPVILVIGVPELASESSLAGFPIRDVSRWEDVVLFLRENRVAVIVFGPSVGPQRIHILLNQASTPPLGNSHIVLYDQASLSAYQDLIDDDLIFYMSHASIAIDQLRKTVAAALQVYSQKERNWVLPHSGLWNDHEDELRILLSRMAMNTDARELSLAISNSLLDYLQAKYARCLFYNSAIDCLGITFDKHETAISAAAGILGYVERTGETVRVESVTSDPRYDPQADNPERLQAAHLIATALHANGRTIAVISALRPTTLGPFTSYDESRLRRFAERVTPLLEVLLLGAHVGEYANERDVFRTEALEYYEFPDDSGSLMREMPLWLSQSHLLLVLFLVSGISCMLIAKVRQQATSPAVVRLAGGPVSVTAPTGGKITSILVKPGSPVRSGDLLCVLQSTRNVSLSAHSYLRAPIDGIVTDVLLRQGQIAAAGSIVMNLERSTDDQVIILFPGYYAPMVQVGIPVVFIPDGYPQSREPLKISAVEPDIMGPSSVNTLIDKDLAQTLQLSGPLVMARAKLPNGWFSSGSRQLQYRNGMTGQAEFSIGSEPLIVAIVPGLKSLYERHQLATGPFTHSTTP